MNILVNGANGFIGTYLCEYLLEKNYNVTGIDISEESNLQHTDYSYKKLDIATEIVNCSMNEKIDGIVHLAQSGRYRDFPEGGTGMIDVNVLGTFYLLEWARIHGVQKFIFASTGNVYAPAPKFLTETDICHPNSFYAATKLS